MGAARPTGLGGDCNRTGVYPAPRRATSTAGSSCLPVSPVSRRNSEPSSPCNSRVLKCFVWWGTCVLAESCMRGPPANARTATVWLGALSGGPSLPPLPARVQVSAQVGIVGRLDPDNWTEVRRQNRQGVYGSVIQGADLQDRRRIVVPFRETADVRCGLTSPPAKAGRFYHSTSGARDTTSQVLPGSPGAFLGATGATCYPERFGPARPYQKNNAAAWLSLAAPASMYQLRLCFARGSRTDRFIPPKERQFHKSGSPIALSRSPDTIAPPTRAKPALLHEAPGQPLSVPRNRVGGTAENHPAIVGRLDQRLCLGSTEGQGLFAVRGHTGLDCGPSDLGVRRVSRQVDEETDVFGPQ